VKTWALLAAHAASGQSGRRGLGLHVGLHVVAGVHRRAISVQVGVRSSLFQLGFCTATWHNYQQILELQYFTFSSSSLLPRQNVQAKLLCCSSSAATSSCSCVSCIGACTQGVPLLALTLTRVVFLSHDANASVSGFISPSRAWPGP
jgi:hypothetical protein